MTGWKRRLHPKTSNKSHTLVSNNIADHSDVVGAPPVDAASTESQSATLHLASMNCAQTTTKRESYIRCLVVFSYHGLTMCDLNFIWTGIIWTCFSRNICNSIVDLFIHISVEAALRSSTNIFSVMNSSKLYSSITGNYHGSHARIINQYHLYIEVFFLYET